MTTLVVRVDPTHPEEAALSRAAGVLRGGGLVAFPTETVYGLGANALDPTAVARIFTAKGRPARNPLIVHIADSSYAHSLLPSWPELAQRLAERFWPGPLTLVLPKAASVPEIVTAGGPTVALRVPAHPVALALLRTVGVPLAAPSANPSGFLSPTRAEHVVRGLEGRIEMILDAGPVPGGIESTVLDLTVSPPRLLRPGLLPLNEIEATIGRVDRLPVPSEPLETPLPSPGLLTRHYAPRTPLDYVEGSGEDRVAELLQKGHRVAWLRFEHPTRPTRANLVALDGPRDPISYAAQLYATLHEWDQGQVDRIVVELPPEMDEWLAIRDRLRRAAAS